jgi:hypothetical protein
VAREITLQITADNTQAVAALREVDRSLEQVAAQAQTTGKAVDSSATRSAGSLQELLQSAKSSAGSMQDLHSKSLAYSQSLGKNEEGLRRVVDQTKRTSEENSRLDSSLAAIGRRLLAVFAVERIVSFGTQIVQTAGNIADLSAKTGLSTSAIQKFGYAAQLSGSNIDQVANAISVMSKNIVGGSSSAVDAFTKLGLSQKALMQMDPEQAFLDIADAIMGMKNPMEQSKAAWDIFGKGGKEILAMIKADVRATTDDIERMGGIMSGDTIKDLDALGDNWTTVWTIMTGYSGKLIGDLASVAGWLAKIAASIPGLAAAFKQIDVSAIMQATGGLVGWLAPAVKRDKAAADFAAGKTGMGDGAAGGFKGGTWTPASIDDLLAIDVPEPVIERTTRLAKAKTDAATATIRLTAAQRDGMQGFAEYAGEVQLAAMYMQQLAAATQIATIAANNPSINSMMLPNAVTSTFQGGGGMTPAGADPRAPRVTFQNGIPQLGDWNGTAGNIANGAMVGMGTVEGIGGLMADTDVAGRGNRAWAGAKRGAQVGAMFGPYGALIGMGVGALVGALRNPGFEQEMKRISRNFGVNISEELARSIDKLRKDFKGDRVAAEIFSMSKIIQEAGGVTDENVTRLTARLRDTFVMLETGKFSTEQATQVLDESFGYFAEHLEKAGGLASKQFLELLALNERFGTESQAMADFIRGQVDEAAGGLQTYLENASVTSAEAASGVTAAVGLLFAELRDQGVSVMDIFDQLGPSIEMLSEQLRVAGIDGGDAFREIADLAAYAADESVQRASAAVDGLSQLMKGLHNAGMMTEDTFKGLARATYDVYKQLDEAGKGGENAFKVMQPGLQQLWEMQRRYGWAVDEGTQALLDQAVAAGVVGAKYASMDEQMLEATKGLTAAVKELAATLRGEVPAAADAAARGITKAFDGLSVTIPVNYEPGRQPDAGSGEYYAQGGVVYAAGGWPKAKGTDTVPAMLTPGEGVLSRRGMATLGALNQGRTGGSGGGVSVTVDLRGATVLEDDPALARRLSDVVERELTARITRERKYSAVVA